VGRRRHRRRRIRRLRRVAPPQVVLRGALRPGLLRWVRVRGGQALLRARELAV